MDPEQEAIAYINQQKLIQLAAIQNSTAAQIEHLRIVYEVKDQACSAASIIAIIFLSSIYITVCMCDLTKLFGPRKRVLQREHPARRRGPREARKESIAVQELDEKFFLANRELIKSMSAKAHRSTKD